MRLFITFFALLFTVSSMAQAHGTQSSNKQISCQEEDGDGGAVDADGNPEVIGTYMINLDEMDRVSDLTITRKDDNDVSAFSNQTFLPKKARFVHDVRANTPQLAQTWNIKQVEVVEMKDRSTGDRVLIRINDHTYSGHPGSTIVLNIGGKKHATDEMGHLVFCSGSLKFPNDFNDRIQKEIEKEKTKNE